eukprot:IDg20621t1
MTKPFTKQTELTALKSNKQAVLCAIVLYNKFMTLSSILELPSAAAPRAIGTIIAVSVRRRPQSAPELGVKAADFCGNARKPGISAYI